MHAVTRPQFEFADGLRAIAALTVALLHATSFTGHLGDADKYLPWIARFIEVGNYAVPVFITLSGYVLMLPVARTTDYSLRGGFWKYLGRRAKRILPPYYAALALFLAMIYLLPAMRTGHGTAWDNKVPVTFEGVLSHIFLVHTWDRSWIYQIDGPAWSVATEWHIYFLLPLLLLPLCRFLKPWVMLAIALLLGPVITILFPETGPGNYWMIGLFAIGMMAALETVQGDPKDSRWYGWAGAGIFALAAVWMVIDPPTELMHQITTDTLAGLGIALGLISMGHAAREGRMTIGRRVFEWRPLVKIGLWSYSIYLIHSPILGALNIYLIRFDLSTRINWLVLVFVGIPIALAISYLFYLLVEKHFITSHQKRALADKPSERASVVVP